ncbi:APC family permease [Companilactobacillus mishanensis]|uniref:Amino acid permease n=1 Tax=Companilactobacillus mishanensis TaxID=2486008 RepID=A0A5P0ZHQ0_9LACO|nr:amino acid permease [Companilactobacillus mishanensis]MQS45150.1 amino acid permease [Companilactobacillus mishanensis]MQS52596.1 amino acid permease [Companilactobacillus mishanensis]
MFKSLFRRKDVIAALKEKPTLQRTMGPMDLTIMGIGVIVGAGIFITPGIIAAKYAGPGVIFTYVLAALVCAGAAFCYSEFSSTIPLSGSAYTYAYSTFGEIIAWFVGWALLSEYMFTGSTVAVSWSAYFRSLLEGFGIKLPVALQSAPGTPGNPGGRFDIVAFIVVLLITFLLLQGLNESVRLNTILVFVKLFVIFLFVIIALFYIKPANFHPFLPFGVGGIGKGASVAFFAFVGFDIISTASEEVKNPKRNMPIGIIASLLICSALYALVSFALVGAVKYTKLNVADPVALALKLLNQNWAAGVISLGAIMGMTTVMIVVIYGGTRLIYSISRDGLLPKNLHKVNKVHVPTTSTILFGLLSAFASAVLPIDKIAELVNVGTLNAFAITSIGVIALRKSKNTRDLETAFQVPFFPIFPIVSFLACAYLLANLQLFTWEIFGVWTTIGLILYFSYGYRKSLLSKSKI